MQEAGEPQSTLEEQQTTPHAQQYHELYAAEIVEDIELYRPGGFHPVVPDDYLGENDRFQVWTKLGQGGFGIVWLCYDDEKDLFCAVKILRDDVSNGKVKEHLSELNIQAMLGVSIDEAWDNHVAVPQEHFWQEGPNGNHLCIVTPVLGPEISRTRCYNWNDTQLLKKVCFQLVEGMAFLHKRGVCHADFRPANILFKTDLHALSVDQMYAYIPAPKSHYIDRLDGVEDNPHAPAYVIEPLELELEDRYISRDIAIIDFGVSFKTSNPPKHVSIPEPWAAPENQEAMGAPPAIATDLWALGITIRQVLFGRSPFSSLEGDFSWAHVEEVLGPVPEPDHNVPRGPTRLWQHALAEDEVARVPTRASYFATTRTGMSVADHDLRTPRYGKDVAGWLTLQLLEGEGTILGLTESAPGTRVSPDLA